MVNVLIAENKDDLAFLEAILKHLKEVSNCSIAIAEFRPLKGICNLTKNLEELRTTLEIENIEKIGIVLDLDQKTISERLTWVNQRVQQVFTGSETIKNTQSLFNLNSSIETKIGCYLLHVKERDDSGNVLEEYGELETVLRVIKTQPSPHADCLAAWKSCIEDKKRETEPNFTISRKKIDKLWVQNYIREDIPSRNEQRKADQINLENALKKEDIWDFAHLVLDELKDFLRLFA